MIKNLPAKAGDPRDVGSVPESGRSPGKGNGNPLQYSWLGNPMDKHLSKITDQSKKMNNYILIRCLSQNQGGKNFWNIRYFVLGANTIN